MKKITLFLTAMLAMSVTINSKTEETTMLPGNAEIVKCPYCGTERVDDITLREHVWSRILVGQQKNCANASKCFSCTKMPKLREVLF